MGMFDTVTCTGEAFKCSEGHSMEDAEFQTKDLGKCMEYWTIGDTVQQTTNYALGDELKRPLLGRINVYGYCRECPAFVQAKTYNFVPMSVEFEVEVVDDKVREVTRVGPDTKDWLVQEPKEPYMEGCFGPMSYDEAHDMHLNHIADRVKND